MTGLDLGLRPCKRVWGDTGMCVCVCMGGGSGRHYKRRVRLVEGIIPFQQQQHRQHEARCKWLICIEYSVSCVSLRVSCNAFTLTHCTLSDTTGGVHSWLKFHKFFCAINVLDKKTVKPILEIQQIVMSTPVLLNDGPRHCSSSCVPLSLPQKFWWFPQLVLLGLVALVAARPDSVINLDLDDIHHDLDIDDGETFTGTYR